MKIKYILSPFLDKIRAFYDVSVQNSKSSPSNKNISAILRYLV